MRLATRDKQAIEELARRVRARLGPRAVAILFYGSKARGTDSVDSDIDVAVLVDRQSPDLRRAVFEEVSAVILDYGVLLDVHVLEARHLKRLKQEGAPYAMRLESEGVPHLNTLESALLAKADAALEQTDLLLKAGHPDGAADRCYYAMFHAASALLASKGLQYTSHRAVLAAVGKELVQPGLLAPKHHRAMLDAFDMRQTADYDVRADLDIGNVEQAYAEAREFATVVRAALGRRAGA